MGQMSIYLLEGAYVAFTCPPDVDTPTQWNSYWTKVLLCFIIHCASQGATGIYVDYATVINLKDYKKVLKGVFDTLKIL